MAISPKVTSGAFGGWKGICPQLSDRCRGVPPPNAALSGRSAALPAREEGGIQKGQNEDSYQGRLLPPTTPVCGDSSLGQPMGLSCRLHCSIDRKLSTARQITHPHFGGDLAENLQPRRFGLIHRSFRLFVGELGFEHGSNSQDLSGTI